MRRQNVPPGATPRFSLGFSRPLWWCASRSRGRQMTVGEAERVRGQRCGPSTHHTHTHSIAPVTVLCVLSSGLVSAKLRRRKFLILKSRLCTECVPFLPYTNITLLVCVCVFMCRRVDRFLNGVDVLSVCVCVCTRRGHELESVWRRA